MMLYNTMKKPKIRIITFAFIASLGSAHSQTWEDVHFESTPGGDWSYKTPTPLITNSATFTQDHAAGGGLSVTYDNTATDPNNFSYGGSLNYDQPFFNAPQVGSKYRIGGSYDFRFSDEPSESNQFFRHGFNLAGLNVGLLFGNTYDGQAMASLVTVDETYPTETMAGTELFATSISSPLARMVAVDYEFVFEILSATEIGATGYFNLDGSSAYSTSTSLVLSNYGDNSPNILDYYFGRPDAGVTAQYGIWAYNGDASAGEALMVDNVDTLYWGQTVAVPEPSGALLLGITGLLGIIRRRRSV